MPAWAEVKEKIQKAIKFVKQNPILDAAARTLIESIPIAGGFLVKVYDKAGGSEEDKTKLILDLLENLQNMNEQQFNRFSQKLDDNRNEILKNRDVLAKLILETYQQESEKLDEITKNIKKLLDIGKIIEQQKQEQKISTIQKCGLEVLTKSYFDTHHSTPQDRNYWKNGWAFPKESVYEGYEFRRNWVLEEIKNKLDNTINDKQKSTNDNVITPKLLLLGAPGTSKSTVLLEIMCDYIKKDFTILYNEGLSDITSGGELAESIEYLLTVGHKIFVAVDNLHDLKVSLIYYVMDRLSRYNIAKENLIFLLAARLPEYEWFVDKRLDKIENTTLRGIIKRLHDDASFKYPMPAFNEDDIKGFIHNFREFLTEDDRKDIEDEEFLSETVRLISDNTQGHPLMVKFSVLGEGLSNDVNERIRTYLKMPPDYHQLDPAKAKTAVICALCNIANSPPTSELLTRMGVIEYAQGDLKDGLLVNDQMSWKTIHTSWDLEMLSQLYNEESHPMMEERKKILKDAVNCIFNCSTNEDMIVSVLEVIYELPLLGAIPIGIIDDVVTEIPSTISQEKSSYVNLVMSHTYLQLNMPDSALQKCTKAIEMDPTFVPAWISRGLVLQQFGKFDEAITCYNKAIELDDSSFVAWNNKGLVLQQLGNYDEAIICFDKAVEKARELDYNFVLPLNNKGFVLQHLRRYDEAIICFDKAIELEPNSSTVLSNKGMVLQLLGRYDEALICYDKAIELDDTFFLAWSNKAMVLQQLGRYDEAIICCDKAIEIDANGSKGWYTKAMVLSKMQKYSEAILIFEKVIELQKPGSPSLITEGDLPVYLMMEGEENILLFSWLHKGICQDNLKDWEGGIKSFDKALDINPNYSATWSAKGITLTNLGRFDQAMITFDKALQLDATNVGGWYGKGLALEKLGRLDQAIQYYNKALEINPKDVVSLNNKGWSYVNLAKYNEATDCFDKALEINPKFVDSLNGKAVALGARGNDNEAIAYYNKALDIDAKNLPAWSGKGITLTKLGNFDEAIACFDKALEINPKFFDALKWKAAALEKSRRYDQAIQYYNKALEINPKDVVSLNNKGWSFGYLHKYHEATDCFDKALEINPKFVDSLFGKAGALARRGNNNEAISYYDKVLEIDAKNLPAWSGKGTIFYDLGMYDDSILCFDKTLELDAKYVMGRYQRARAQVKKGKVENSLEDLKKVKELLNNNPYFINLVQSDSAFDSIRKNKEFKSILGTKN